MAGKKDTRNAAAENAAAENAAAEKEPALEIASKREGFRRAGRVFGAKPTVIKLSDLSKEEVNALENEPMLTVSETEIDAPAE